MFCKYKIVVTTAALGFASPAHADTMDRPWFFADSDPFSVAAKACQKEIAARGVAACTHAINLASKNSADRKTAAYLLLKRSNAHLGARNFSEAIRDADEGARMLPGSHELTNQRCWARAVANRDLTVARKLCERVFYQKSASSALLTSIALIEMRECNWESAGNHYIIAYRLNEKKNAHALYGVILSVYGKMHYSTKSEVNYQKIIDSNLQYLTIDQLSAAKSVFESVGLTQEALVSGQMKCPASKNKAALASFST